MDNSVVDLSVQFELELLFNKALIVIVRQGGSHPDFTNVNVVDETLKQKPFKPG